MTGGGRLAALVLVMGLVAACSTETGPADAPGTSAADPTTTGAPDPTTSPTAPTTTGPPATTTAPTTTAPTATAPSGPPGPVWARDFPDPFVLVDGREYHAYATTSGLVLLPHLESTDLAAWAGPTAALPVGPPWADRWSEWAPALLVIDDRYLLYYTARVAGTDMHCVSVAESDTPVGPFVDTSATPLLCPRDLGGAIDPSPFVDGDGARYLLWKSDGVTLRQESAIWSQPLAADGRSFAGDAVRLIDTDQDWEYPHVEAPSMLRAGDTYWLAYSGNWWNQDAYGIGFARCAGATGPCEKPFDGPIVASSPGAEGPGGSELFVDGDGRTAMAYHAWLAEPGYPGHRALWIADVDLTGELPVVRPRPGG